MRSHQLNVSGQLTGDYTYAEYKKDTKGNALNEINVAMAMWGIMSRNGGVSEFPVDLTV